MGKVYVEENRGYITASKLKDFIKSPEYFFLKYIKEVPDLKEEEKVCFKLGTAIDDLISYWENEFFKKYYIDEGLLKAELEDRLFNMGVDTKGLKVEDMKALIYWDIENKKRLTAWEWETVLGCVNELRRQKLFDKDGAYNHQKTYIGKYKNLQLKGTLDRDGTEIIRDTKTTWNINKFLWEWRDLGYDVSMTFYWVLKLKATGEKSKLILDVVQKTYPYPSRIFEIPQGDILNIVDHTIIPALDTLDALMTAWEQTKDESIWKVRQKDFTKLATCDFYPIMESAIQQEVEVLQ